MILIGCLSILSGVVVAGLYHHDKTKPVPKWLLKLTQIDSLPQVTTLEPNFNNEKEKEQLPDDESRIENTSNGHGISSISYPVEEPQAAFTNPRLGSSLDYTSDWRRVTAAVDKLFFVIGMVFTIGAILLTILLFVTSEELYE